MSIVKRTVPHIILMIYVVAILAPFVFIILSSFKENNIDIAEHPFGWPAKVVFDNYVDAWVKGNISKYFLIALTCLQVLHLLVFYYPQVRRLR